MSRDLRDALDVLEKEKNISKDTLLEAIEQSLIQACKNHFGKADNVHVMIDPETCDFSVYADRTVVEHVEDPALEISLVDAQKTNTNAEIGDVMKVEIQSKEFGRIATQNAKNVILQKIREEERKVLYDQCTVSFDVCFLKISKKATSLTYHFQKTSSGMMIFVVCFKMLCELLDSCCKNCNLNLR